ncbi:MAG: hypothetical protein FJZ59_06010 [Chlamydiae bacterium]|nr:hypothetical protein [Chlamydiota bacterium]
MISAKDALNNINTYLQFSTSSIKGLALHKYKDRIILTGYEDGVVAKVIDVVINLLSCAGFFKRVSPQDESTKTLFSRSFNCLKGSLDESESCFKSLCIYTSDQRGGMKLLWKPTSAPPKTIEELAASLQSNTSHFRVYAYLQAKDRIFVPARS